MIYRTVANGITTVPDAPGQQQEEFDNMKITLKVSDAAAFEKAVLEAFKREGGPISLPVDGKMSFIVHFDSSDDARLAIRLSEIVDRLGGEVLLREEDESMAKFAKEDLLRLALELAEWCGEQECGPSVALVKAIREFSYI